MANEFKPTVGKKIAKGQIKKWQLDYQTKYPEQTKSVFFGKDQILAIFKNTSVTGISFLFCRKNEDGREFNDIAMVGTTLDGKLIWREAPGSSGKDMPDEESATDTGLPCPPYCPSGDDGDDA